MTIGDLTVPDGVVISFFTAAVLAQSATIIALWKKLNEKDKDKDKH